MKTYRALDLGCGQGGTSHGLALTGRFDVTGVDNNPDHLALYPYRKIEADYLEYCEARGTEYDFIFGGPTCTGYSRGTAAHPDRLTKYDRLIPATRDVIVNTGRPYIIENVADARSELIDPVLLCGRAFDLGAEDYDGEWLVLDRHRLFEAGNGLALTVPEHPKHLKPWVERETGWARGPQVAGVYGGARRDKWEARYERKGAYVPAELDTLRALIGAPWMNEAGLFLAIPPAFTEYLGHQVATYLDGLS